MLPEQAGQGIIENKAINLHLNPSAPKLLTTAISMWLSQVSEFLDIVESIEDPVEATYGMLSHIKKTGVELQHEA
ncbi:MAG: hypothetical protein QXN24_04350 [Candidatus Bathyarchaeia archaeon]